MSYVASNGFFGEIGEMFKVRRKVEIMLLEEK
jgi:hypothetical protein